MTITLLQLLIAHLRMQLFLYISMHSHPGTGPKTNKVSNTLPVHPVGTR